MSTSNRFAPEGRERSVRTVAEHQHEFSSECEEHVEVDGDPQTLRKWVRRAEIEGGSRVAADPSEMAVEPGFNIERSEGPSGVEPTPARRGTRPDAR